MVEKSLETHSFLQDRSSALLVAFFRHCDEGRNHKENSAPLFVRMDVY